VFSCHFWEFQFFFAVLPLLERTGFIVFDQQAANQPPKTKRPNASQNADAHHHHNSCRAFQAGHIEQH
jgi:hypothetical protein